MKELELPESVELHLREHGWVPRKEVLREVRRLLKAGWEPEEINHYLENSEDFQGAF